MNDSEGQTADEEEKEKRRRRRRKDILAGSRRSTRSYVLIYSRPVRENI